jgi:dienelactone hydrolase
MRRLLAPASLLLLSAAAAATALAAEAVNPPPPAAGVEKVTVDGHGGWKLDAFYAAPAAKAGGGKAPAVILTHMLGHAKEDWMPLVPRLTAAGCAVVAYDMRGHGRSVDAGGKSASWRDFEAADWEAAEKDIAAVRDWLLAEKGSLVDAKRIALVGASIGANLSLRALDADPALRGAVLLSPGLDYRGVRTAECVGGLAAGQKVLVCATQGDAAASEAARVLGGAEVPAGTEVAVRTLPGTEHGTVMFASGANVRTVIGEITGALGRMTERPEAGTKDEQPKDDVRDALDKVL